MIRKFLFSNQQYLAVGPQPWVMQNLLQSTAERDYSGEK